MSSRKLVIARVKTTMLRSFDQGDTTDAQNLNVWLASLEVMSDAEYEECIIGEISGAIS